MKNNNDKLSELVFLLMLSHMRWRKIQEEGCNDPFWSDGANLNLIRNHIIYFRDEIRKLCENKNLPLPELYYEEVPPKVDDNYMVKREEILEKAKRALKMCEDDPNFKRSIKI